MLLAQYLELARCPHCRIDHPNLSYATFLVENQGVGGLTTTDHQGQNKRLWKLYTCSRCGGAVLGGALIYSNKIGEISEIYPAPVQVDEALPPTAKEYLTQAINSLHAPAGSVMLCASAVDAMLKAKGYTENSLCTRINKAAADHLITEGMKEWAHEVRLDANDQRHADQAATLPTPADAQRSIEFAQSLGQFLFVLPAQVARGRAAAQVTSTRPPKSRVLPKPVVL